MHTTIGACTFHFRVRNGIGWFHTAIVTRERVEGRQDVGSVRILGQSAHGSAGFMRGTRHTGAHALRGWEVANIL